MRAYKPGLNSYKDIKIILTLIRMAVRKTPHAGFSDRILVFRLEIFSNMTGALPDCLVLFTCMAHIVRTAKEQLREKLSVEIRVRAIQIKVNNC